MRTPSACYRTWAWRALAFWALFTPKASQGAVVRAQTVEQMASQSQLVVEARVGGHQCEWDQRHRFIFTVTELEVVDVWSGSAPALIKVRTLGGQVDGVAMNVSGAARLQEGQRVILFLSSDGQKEGQYRIRGLSQGMFRVIEREKELIAVPEMGGLILTPSLSPRTNSTGPHASVSMPLSRLRARVQAVGADD